MPYKKITKSKLTAAEVARLYGRDGIIQEGRQHTGYQTTTVRVPATPTYLGGIVSTINSETE